MYTVKPVLRDRSRDPPKMWSHMTGGLLTQVYYREKCTFGALKRWSLNTGGLKDRFDCTCLYIERKYISLNTEADTLA